jgi:hypothetical protein
MSSRFIRAFLLVLSGTLAGAACATTRAETPRERPALDVPVPPPRVILPMPPEAPLPEPVGELPGSSAPPPTRPRPQQQRPADTNAKPDPKQEETAKPPDPNPPNAVAPPVPQLRTPEVGNSAQVAAQVRDTIERTKKTLDNIDYRTLAPVRQKAYDAAKLFYTQAEEMLRNNNLLAAKELAEKAERLAKDLQGR